MNYPKGKNPNLEWYRRLSLEERAQAFDDLLQQLEEESQQQDASLIHGTFSQDWEEYLSLGSFFVFNISFLEKAIASNFPLVGLFLCSTSYDYNRRFDAFMFKIRDWRSRKILCRLTYDLFHNCIEDTCLLECVRRLHCRFDQYESLDNHVRDKIREFDLKVFHPNRSDRSFNTSLNYAIRTAFQLLNTIELENSDRQRHLELYDLFVITLNLIPDSGPDFWIRPEGIEVMTRAYGGDKTGLIKQRIYAQEKVARTVAEKEEIKIVRRLQ
jgi:hypothetical protein